jgi:hypothetical protein
MPVFDEVPVAVGDKVYAADTDWLEIVFGLFVLGKVPTSWSGRPFAVSTRELLVHDQLDVLVAFTEAVLLKAL